MSWITEAIPRIEAGAWTSSAAIYNLKLGSTEIREAIMELQARADQLSNYIVSLTSTRDNYLLKLQEAAQFNLPIPEQPIIPSEPSIPGLTQAQQASLSQQASLMAGFPSWAIIPLAGMALFMLFGKKKKGRRK
jgi:hypothetical protein